MTTRITFNDLKNAYRKGRKLTMLTAYDYAFAKLIDRCGIDMILVGDSLANVFLGKSSTREVDLETMLYHAKAVTRGVEHALVIGDMPFSAYQIKPREAAANARRFIDEAGCQAVKIEWFDGCLDVTKKIFAAGIPVMGHVGLTPQSVESSSGFKVQGKTAQAAREILNNAKALAKCGVFGIVLECIPDQLASLITREISVPTIGIGAGPQTSGQVLVIHDLLGLLEGFNPKFSKKFADAGKLVSEGVKRYKEDVETGRFPDREHSYIMSDEEFRKLT